MAKVLPATAPTSVRVAQLHVMSTWHLAGSEPRRVWLALQYQFTDKWVLATFVWRENERGFQAIDGFQITPLPASLETISPETVSNRAMKWLPRPGPQSAHAARLKPLTFSIESLGVDLSVLSVYVRHHNM